MAKIFKFPVYVIISLLLLWGSFSYSKFIPFIASFGGLVVLVGLILEEVADPEKYKSVDHLRFCKRWEKHGRDWVILGVFIEVLVGFGISSREFKDFLTTEASLQQIDSQISPRIFPGFGNRRFPEFYQKYFCCWTNTEKIKALIISDEDRECKELASRISFELSGGVGWDAKLIVSTNFAWPDGISLNFFPGSEWPIDRQNILMYEAALDLYDVFTNCGLKTIWLEDDNFPRGIICIAVGPRPNKYDLKYLDTISWLDDGKTQLKKLQKFSDMQTNLPANVK